MNSNPCDLSLFLSLNKMIGGNRRGAPNSQFPLDMAVRVSYPPWNVRLSNVFVRLYFCEMATKPEENNPSPQSTRMRVVHVPYHMTPDSRELLPQAGLNSRLCWEGGSFTMHLCQLGYHPCSSNACESCWKPMSSQRACTVLGFGTNISYYCLKYMWSLHTIVHCLIFWR